MSDSGAGWDWQAFDRSYRRLVFSIARRATRNDFDAEDITQEVMLKAFRYIETLRKHENPKAWFVRVTKTAVVDFYRKPANRPGWVALKEGSEPTITAAPVDDWIDPLHWLAPYLEGLPDSAGALIETGIRLGCWDERVLAEKLGRKPKAVRTAIYKIRGLLLDAFGWGEWVRLLRLYTQLPLPQETLDAAIQLEVLSQRDPSIRSRFWNAVGDNVTVHFPMLHPEIPVSGEPFYHQMIYEALGVTGYNAATCAPSQSSKGACLDYARENHTLALHCVGKADLLGDDPAEIEGDRVRITDRLAAIEDATATLQRLTSTNA